MMGQAAAAAALPAPSSAGFPASYPYAYSAPLPAALLRPLQQPLYDTEIVPSANTPNEIRYFQRQLGQVTAFGNLNKTAAETNLGQPGQLANPLEFSLFGFNYVILADQQVEETPAFVLLGDFTAITADSVFTFLYTGNRIYLQIPLCRIPQGVAPEGFSALSNQVQAEERTIVHNGVGHISNFYKFTIGRSALRMRPTEAFQVRLEWPNGAPTITVNTRTQVYLLGLQWTPL